MSGVRDAEVMTVGTDEAVVTFVTDPDVEVTARVGDTEVTTTGPNHFAHFTGLQPATGYEVEVDGFEPDEFLPRRVSTLAVPKGKRLGSLATANDVHFGEVECGRVHDDPAVGPIVRAEPGEPPYPETMNGSAIDEMLVLDPDVVLVKGDLTNLGSNDEYAAFLAAYGRLGSRMHHVRGNHDAMLDPTIALEGAPYAVDVGGATLAVLDTVVPRSEQGQITAAQLGWLREVAGATTGPVLVFGHHHLWDLDATERSAAYFGVNPDDSEAFGAVVAEHENVVAYFAGHTHRNRVRRSTKARNVPFVEISATKDYPGVWAEYGLYEDGFTQVVRRVSAPAALVWTERTRPMYHGLYRPYALGRLEHRCFTEHF